MEQLHGFARIMVKANCDHISERISVKTMANIMTKLYNDIAKAGYSIDQVSSYALENMKAINEELEKENPEIRYTTSGNRVENPDEPNDIPNFFAPIAGIPWHNEEE